MEQIKGMGCSCDYSDEHFTLDPDYVDAVRRLFVDWYHNGLIYRGKRIVNWCPHCTTAIADDEAEYVDETGHLWYLRYPLTQPVDGHDYIVVATTRPETMLGDTGVAVSPKDEEAKKFVGATVKLPLVDREIPIFSDYYVDAGFGTGFVKVTPAHDPNDWGMGSATAWTRSTSSTKPPMWWKATARFPAWIATRPAKPWSRRSRKPVFWTMWKTMTIPL